MKELQYLGNSDLINVYKFGFLCSRRIPSDTILKTYDWAIEQREKGVCVVSGFHSKIEKDVFHYLLKGTQPIIMVLARSIYKKTPDLLKTEVDKGRLLIISPFGENVKRASQETAYDRNRYILEISDELYIPYVNPNGRLSKLIDSMNGKNIVISP